MRSWRVRVALCLTALLAVTAAIVSVGPARAAVESFLACASTTPCLEWDNSKSGDAIKGVSSNGTALEGRTQFTSAGKKAGKSGVLGADTSTSGNLNSGVIGTSINGTGVTGSVTSSSGLNGVTGLTSSGASGVYGQNSSTGFGVAGRSTSTTHNNSAAAVLADGGTANDGVHALSSSSNAIYAVSQSGSAAVMNQGANASAQTPVLRLSSGSGFDHSLIIGGSSDNPQTFEVDNQGNILAGDVRGHKIDALDLVVDETFSVHSNQSGAKFTSDSGIDPTLIVASGEAGSSHTVFDAVDSNGMTLMGLSDSGDLGVQGQLFSMGSCRNGCVAGRNRVRDVVEYSAVESEPTIEDNGEAQLVDGHAYVALDKKLVNVIDDHSAYLVSVTPEGDCDALYVAQRTPDGFTVRESRNGQDNVAFEYRIVAKRYGVRADRLPMTNVISQPPSRHSSHAR